MIIGIGIDTVSIARFERILSLRGERFLERVFSSAEVFEGLKRKRKAPFFAARFAAREAFVKALGTGFIPGTGLRDMTIVKGERGKPALSFSSRLEEMLDARGVSRCHLSMAHDGDNAQAIVILEGARGARHIGKGQRL